MTDTRWWRRSWQRNRQLASAVDEARMERVWSRIGDRARAEGVLVSLAHACGAGAQAVGAFGAGLSVTLRAGAGEPTYATDVRCDRLAELQFTLGEGPCVEAFAEDGTVLVED